MTRIGMVNYINTAPIYEIWKEQVHEQDWRIIEAPPSELNRMLAAAELDLGFVSSREYGVRPDRYRILADLSISATGPVGSVFLFSEVKPEQLDGQPVLMTGQSDTSVCLLKLVLEEFIGVRPEYYRGEIFDDGKKGRHPVAVLAIGDEALRLRFENRYPVRLDLAEAWHDQTGLPFVFAVCAVREEYLRDHGEEVRKIHQTLLTCRARGLARLPEICERVARRIPMDCAACSSYLHAMEYDLQYSKQEALTKFFQLLIERKEADARCLPLKVFS
ncbi:MAG TPA: ABC transporter substrate-binding protein [Desulfobulbaceae bacterium]|nr:ABC transporter substrate-binding protein [Desulfobulbaceae bacterium]